jgi:hypothetical protein
LLTRLQATALAIGGVCVAAALGNGAWVGRGWLLLSAAGLWIVSGPFDPADAVAIFGGGIAGRPFAAAQYHRLGLARKF